MAGRRQSAPSQIEAHVFRPPCVICGENAICWIRGSNVCHDHYIEIFRKEGKIHAALNNLNTPADHMRYIREVMAKPKNPRDWMLNPKSQRAADMAAEINSHVMKLPLYEEREPGSDDE